MFRSWDSPETILVTSCWSIGLVSRDNDSFKTQRSPLSQLCAAFIYSTQPENFDSTAAAVSTSVSHCLLSLASIALASQWSATHVYATAGQRVRDYAKLTTHSSSGASPDPANMLMFCAAVSVLILRLHVLYGTVTVSSTVCSSTSSTTRSGPWQTVKRERFFSSGGQTWRE